MFGNTASSRPYFPDTGFLAEASEALRRVLAEHATEAGYAAGCVVMQQDDEGDSLYAVLEGRFEISVLSLHGRKLSLDLMGPGALFGEIALFDPGPRIATVTAMTDGRLLRLRHAELLRALHETPDVAADLLRLAGLRMRWMGRQLHEQVFLPMPARLARKLIHLAPEGGPDTVALSQAELAEYVGATREAVSKTLAGWRRQGVIEVSRRGLAIRDRAALGALADPEAI